MTLAIQLSSQPAESIAAEALLLPLHEGFATSDASQGASSPLLSKLDALLGNALIEHLKLHKPFKGKLGDASAIPTYGKLQAPYIIAVGLGKKEDLNAKALRRSVAAGIRAAMRLKLASVALAFESANSPELDDASSARLLAEGAILGAYQFDTLKGNAAKTGPNAYGGLKTLHIIAPEAQHATLQPGIQLGEIIAQATCTARDWVFDSANNVTPTYLAEQALQIEGLQCTVLGPDEIQQLGMGAFWQVAKGSIEPPKLIHLSYKPSEKAASGNSEPIKTIAIVGKGVTFDSGGLSLKPAGAMELMKMDMAGAAAAISTMGAIARLAGTPQAVKHRVEAFIPACENMPSGHAGRPGDVITAMNGKTIEINNTDAEGRLILADALTYAQKQCNPDELIDLATLTGACVIALGKEAAAIMGTPKVSQPLIDALLASAERAGEYLWPLPIYDEYKDCLKSPVADLINSGAKGEAGSSKGGVFLQAFVDKSRAWAHLDIAGPAYTGKDWPEVPKGATGYGVRTLLYYLLNLA
ncbi:MAG: leucyl aminopeptidase [Vampirovibrionales bacterium]|nr:leucyl aminopeptidase [Vampirovibrionales bacterium]